MRGHAIGTTVEHPFYVVERNTFVPAGQIAPGETFLSDDGQLVTLETILDTGRVETVYNFRIADFHTYFVGGKEWGFSVWVHNTTYLPQGMSTDRIRMQRGMAVGGTQLPTVNQKWLVNGAGAIPGQIASQLTGREFSSFKHFRSELWKLVAADPSLAKQFKKNNLRLMRRGQAPFAPAHLQTGTGAANMRFNLDHIDPLGEQFSTIDANRLLYDLDNIQVVAPFWNQVR